MTSANGSITFPKSDTKFRLRAIWPSSKSVSSIMPYMRTKTTLYKTGEKDGKTFGTKKNKKKKGAITSLVTVSLFGRFIIHLKTLYKRFCKIFCHQALFLTKKSLVLIS